MTPAQKQGIESLRKAEKLDHLPRTHANCIKATGVARPGKTAKERAKSAGLIR